MTPALLPAILEEGSTLAGLSVGMVNDPGEEPGDLDKRKDEIDEHELEELTGADLPSCPRCGWRDTRLSHTRSMLDSILRTFSLRAFRCRSCGNRFRVPWRVPKG